VCIGGDGKVALAGEVMSYDPQDTRSDDEIEGVVWPPPEPMTPEMERFYMEMMRQAGEACAATRDTIIIEVLNQ